MRNHVVVAELDVLKLDGLFEVGEAGGTGSEQWSVGASVRHDRSRRDVIGSQKKKPMDLTPEKAEMRRRKPNEI